MKHIFLIAGYGVPKDIFKDDNYRFYLRLAFNRIWDEVQTKGVTEPMVIFSGGKTDMFKPFKRDEAGEMMKYFKELMAQPAVKAATKKWKLVAERKSLSTLENLLFSKKLMEEKGYGEAGVTILCEFTRIERLKKVATKVFGRKIQVVGIDFDQSENRYLDGEFLKKKEAVVMKYDLLALKDEDMMKKHHKAHVEKIDHLRKLGPKVHVEEVKKWWQNLLEKEFSTEK